MEFKRWSACVTYATNIASEHARSSRLTRYVRLSLLPQAGEGLTVYARCSDGSKKGYLFVSNVCEHKDSSANFGPYPKVAAHVSVTRKLAQRARAQSQLATPTHASGMC